MSDTPRTDGAHRACSGLFRAASTTNGFLAHAKQLERELAMEKARVDFLIARSEEYWSREEVEQDFVRHLLKLRP